MMKIAKPSVEKAGGVRVPKPKSEAKPIVDKGSSGKGSGDKKIGSHAGSGKNVATVRKLAKDPQRTGGSLTTSALYPVGEILIPVVSELAEIGLLDNQITPQQFSFSVYGNYCGFGHGDPTGNTPPIDAVDAICREHDRSYCLLASFDSCCDGILIEIMLSA